jgi:hypothetical protein
LVDVSESEMLTAGDIVELITKITVASICQEMDQEGYSAEEND